MNCKQGDLAIYKGEDRSCWGRIVRCISLHPLCSRHFGIPHWVVDPPLPRTENPSELAVAVADCALQPIRDPGEDATDEMLQRLGKPESAAIEWALGAERTA